MTFSTIALLIHRVEWLPVVQDEHKYLEKASSAYQNVRVNGF